MDFIILVLTKKILQLQKENQNLYNLLNEEQQKLQSTITQNNENTYRLQAELNATKKALAIRESQIESAVLQYNKLMETAIAYRNDALRKRHHIT